MGQLAIQPAAVSHNLPKGHKEFTYEQLHRSDIWEEEPYQWEAPYHLSVRRNYIKGPYTSLLFSVDIAEKESGSKVTFKFSGDVKGFTGKFWLKRNFGRRFKKKLKRIIHDLDTQVTDCKSGKLHPIRGLRWKSFHEKLTNLSTRENLSARLISFLENSSEHDVQKISPLRLSKKWNTPLNDVLDILFFASKLDILNFHWDLLCPHCRRKQHQIDKLNEITEPLFCPDCKKDFHLDFNNTIELIFQPNSLVQKLSNKVYCKGNPTNQPHIKLQQYLHPGQKQFVRVQLEPGNYKIYSEGLTGVIHATVEPEGLEFATLRFTEERDKDHHVTLSTDSNLVIHNQTKERLFVKLEDSDWTKYRISALEVTSLQLFRNLFPSEVLKVGGKVKAQNLTVMFTDLSESTMMYKSDGDELATGHVINHFEILRTIVNEERGAIVKTIGDSVMAVFQSPLHALQAFHRAQVHFKTNTEDTHHIKLKGGIHRGDCIAVTLNNRIDFFGNTINVASRLVENASCEELVISKEAYNNRKLEEFISENRNSIHIQHHDLSLKGFEESTFQVKCLSLNKSPLRLVV